MLIIRDTKGNIFGGFAACPWNKPSSNWYGSVQCFLFTIKPKFEIFHATGYNNHFMYLNEGKEMLPNGVGMGGQHDYFGLFIHESFDWGSSHGICSTYKSPCLSSSVRFDIDIIEVWSCKLPVVVEDPTTTKKKSALNSENNPDRAIMEMAGRVSYSQCLEPLEDQTQ